MRFLLAMMKTKNSSVNSIDIKSLYGKDSNCLDIPFRSPHCHSLPLTIFCFGISTRGSFFLALGWENAIIHLLP